MAKAPEKIIADMSLPAEGGFWVPDDMTPTWDRRETYCRADRVVDRAVAEKMNAALWEALTYYGAYRRMDNDMGRKARVIDEALAAYEEATNDG